MIVDLEKVSIYVKPGKTDMRKQINGLSVIVQEELQMDPFSGSLFLFCNKSRRLLEVSCIGTGTVFGSCRSGWNGIGFPGR